MQKMSKKEQCQSRFFFRLTIFSTARNVFFLLSGCHESLVLYFFLFQQSKSNFRPTMSKFWKNRIQFVMFSLKIPTVKSWFPDFQSSSPVATNAKSYSVFLLKSARNCPPSKSRNRSEVSRYSFVWLCRKSGQFVKDFSTNKVSLFPFFCSCT